MPRLVTISNRRRIFVAINTTQLLEISEVHNIFGQFGIQVAPKGCVRFTERRIVA
jgi:hypothetical protein